MIVLLKKLLLSLLLIGTTGTAAAAGTAATFAAHTANAGESFSSGTLVLDNTRTGGTSCLSSGPASTDGNDNARCDQLIVAAIARPGDTAEQTLTISNAGSLDGGVLKAFSTACTNGDSAETYHGTGSPCAKVQLYVQAYSDAAFTTPSACLYGGATGNTCDFSDATRTLSAFQSAYSSASGGLTVANTLNAGASVYLKVGMKLPADAGNSLQGRQASMDFNWYVEQR